MNVGIAKIGGTLYIAFYCQNVPVLSLPGIPSISRITPLDIYTITFFSGILKNTKFFQFL